MTDPSVSQQNAEPIRVPGGYFLPVSDAGFDSQEITLGEILQRLRENWKVIAACALLGAVLLGGLAFAITPVFRGEVLLMPSESDDSKNSRIGALSSQLSGLASFGIGKTANGKDEAVAVLKSRALTNRFVMEKNLLPVLFESKWDAGANRWKDSDPAKAPTLWDAYKLFDELRQVTEDKKTGLVTLTIDWKDKQLAADWANELVKRTNEYMSANALQRASGNIAFLQEQLQKTTVVEIQNSINNLIEGELKKTMLARNSNEYAFKVLDPAVVPEKKIKPRRLLYAGGGAVLGLLIGVVIAWFGTPSGRFRTARAGSPD